MMKDDLTVANGFPIANFDQGRNGGIPDMDAVLERSYNWGLELAEEYDVGTAYTTIFDVHITQGKHPLTAAENALKSLGIISKDEFLVNSEGDDEFIG